MSTTYYTTKTLNVLGCHVCSKCQSIIANEFSAKAIGISSLTTDIATIRANDGVTQILSVLQDFPQKPFLVTHTLEKRTLHTHYRIDFDGAERVCPYCGAIEKWQSDYSYAPACKVDKLTGVHLVADVPLESRMRVFFNMNDAVEYCSGLMSTKADEYRQHWIQNANKKERIQKQIEDLKYKLHNMESQYNETYAKSKFIFKQIQEKETELKIFSLFSPERKLAKAELKKLKKEYTIQRANDFACEKDLASQISNIKTQIKTLFVENPGVIDETETVTNPDTRLQIAYRIS